MLLLTPSGWEEPHDVTMLPVAITTREHNPAVFLLVLNVLLVDRV